MMKPIKNLTLLLTFTLSTLISGLTYAEWTLIKDERKIQLFTSNHPEHTYTSRITAHVAAPMASIIEVLEDPSACKNWLFRCQTAQRISEEKSNHLYTYYVRDYPFPLKDRHGVIEISRDFNKSGDFELTMKLVPSMTPEDTTLIIPETFEAKITLRKTSNNTSTLSLEHKLNPGGKVPSWLKKSLHEEFPFNSIQGLIESAQQITLSNAKSSTTKGITGI